MDPLTVGLVGCGNISERYLTHDAHLDAFEIEVCADLDAERAERTADEFDVEARGVEELMDSDDVEAVLNLTPPFAHAEVCLQALEAGKHVYTEKPLATERGDAAEIVETAAERGLFVGAAPDTFLGAGLQTARSVIDEGGIGEPLGATAVWSSPGHEHWHPDPDLFYAEGGGPGLDMGPYYVTALVALLGPAERVAGTVGQPHDEREITSGYREGESVGVEVPTHESATLDFGDGVTANLLFSFDVAASTFPMPAFEIYGTEGTLALPDPNHFEGPVRVRGRTDDEWEEVPLTHDYTTGRGGGLVDLAYAVRSDWEQRASGRLGRHVLDILLGIRSSAEAGVYDDLETELERPAALPPAFPDRSA
ncbi:MAG: Gfo/Idh/MocA family oxidoreductase [Haloarculaceae archaeon]